MLQYDLTGTRFFDAETRAGVPTDAEVFAITAALLLIQDVAYGELDCKELELAANDVENVAQCIEYRLPVFTRDIGCGLELRERLADFAGLRIGCLSTSDTDDCQRPK